MNPIYIIKDGKIYQKLDGGKAVLVKVKDGVKFDDLTAADVKVLNKDAIQEVKTKNPQLPFPLGI